MGKGEIVLKTEALRSVGERVIVGTIVGLEQIGLEKLDEQRGADPISITALQNVILLIQTVALAGVTLMSKSGRIRAFAADGVASSSTMLAYRIGKVAAPTISGFTRRFGNRGSRIGGSPQQQSRQVAPLGMGAQFSLMPS